MIQGGSVLLLLSLFFAYLLSPVVAQASSRFRLGRRGRPLPRPAAILLLYLLLFVPGAVAWHVSSERIQQWVRVTAPEAVDHLLSGGDFDTIDHLIAATPMPVSTRPAVKRRVGGAVGYIQREAHAALNTLIDAARYAAWLVVAPVLAFVLLTAWPAFRRSTLRVLPRGHLQWRGEEYFQDVNSALAGYIRAQTVAGIVIGLTCVSGFALIGVPSAVSMGVAAGVLELVPGIGPVTALLIAVTQSGDKALAVIAFLVALRIVQDVLVYPRLIRHGMHLSRPALVLSLWTGAVLGGPAGVVLAIPVAGFVSVSLRHWREYRAIERLVRTSAHHVVAEQPDRSEHERQGEAGREDQP